MQPARLVYLGADDGTLHAFYASTGQEAFAFIPADMVRSSRSSTPRRPALQPERPYLRLAGSPKVKNLCVANCKVAE